MTVTVGKGVELLQIADRMCGFRLYPGAQTGLQRTVLTFERARGKSLPLSHSHDARLFTGYGGQHGNQFGMGNIVGHSNSGKHFRH